MKFVAPPTLRLKTKRRQLLQTSTPPVSVQVDREISVTTYTRVKDQETSIICETLTLPVTLQEENGGIKNVIGAGIGLVGVVGLLL